MSNPYQPWLATINDIVDEVGGERGIKTFKLTFNDKKVQKKRVFVVKEIK